MPPKPTLADLRRRLMELQADVDETIQALDAVRPEPAPTTKAPGAVPVRGRQRRKAVPEEPERPPQPPVAGPARGANRFESVTMRDVGRAAGVSQSTVSRVLTPTTTGLPINEATRRRVLDKVRELGYHPNVYARSLRGMKSHMLAMMVADITNPFYHPWFAPCRTSRCSTGTT
jgi:hypothetical protein